MNLTPGSRFGAYEIVGPIGAGGMGAVYRARDSRLDRDVALKTLPPAFTADTDRLSRFEREARVLASLNHPGIAAIYGIEESAGVRALVLEFVDGETLAQRLARARSGLRSLPMSEAIAMAREIAEALDAAHERGIVHRDLKPANVGLTAAGVVKLLDFGLAKTVPGGMGGFGRDHSGAESAATMAATESGMFLGTAAYVSPEQARGQQVDKRTDIWAFGCVLFEMLAGTPAFGRPTIPDTIAAIVDHEPDWRALPAGTSPTVRRLVERCLQKDVRRRLRDIGDAFDDLAPFAPDPKADAPPATTLAVTFHRLTDDVGMNDAPAISPDGKMVAFVAVAHGRRQVWIRLLAGGAPLQLTNDDADHLQPRWAPDSSALIYYTPSGIPGAEGGLWEISALGGVPRPIAGALSGGDISHDGRRIALLGARDGGVMLLTIARDGSDARPVARVPRGHTWRSPRWSRDDARLAFHARGLTIWDEILWVVPARGGDSRPIARAAFMRGLSWLPDGSGLV